MRTDINLLGHLSKGPTRLENVVISIATLVKVGRMQTREGFKVGDRYRFEGVDGRKGRIQIRRIDRDITFFVFKPDGSIFYKCRAVKRKVV